MKTYNDDPNFSIVLPGGCNAECSFCFNNENKTIKPANIGDYINNLRKVLDNLDDNFYQISITGGEPLLSPFIDAVLALLVAYKRKYTNILLTTNGTNLINKIDLVSLAVDHINISRHNHDEKENNTIFGGSYYMNDEELLNIIDKYGERGVDVSANCVINDATSKLFIDDYISWGRSMGLFAIRFRKENGDIQPTPVECEYNSYKVLWKGSCPVCRTIKQRIKGVDVFWKSSTLEPSDIIKKSIFELVFKEDAIVYTDWDNQNVVSINSQPKISERVVYVDRSVSSSSCGGSSSSRC
ncbi:MAG: radical SAM protein [Deltaproteobacteria bacterium]|nr:radical SAM protein [Deltaproteobacteria bacterium]